MTRCVGPDIPPTMRNSIGKCRHSPCPDVRGTQRGTRGAIARNVACDGCLLLDLIEPGRCRAF